MQNDLAPYRGSRSCLLHSVIGIVLRKFSIREHTLFVRY